MSGKIDKVLNISGLQQPQSMFLITKTLEKVQPGDLLEIVSPEKRLMENIPQEFEDISYRIVEVREKNGLVYYTIVKE